MKNKKERIMLQKYDTNLNAATTRFWNSLYFNDNDVLENLLAPDCHIMLKNIGTGCIGINECIKILNDIQNKIKLFEIEKGKLRFTMKLNKIKRSARFLITPIDSTLKFNLGFQLEWECGIVIGIKIVEDPSPGFLVIKKTGKSLSDVQNSVLRQQTGPSHLEWRTISKTKISAFVLPKDIHNHNNNGVSVNNEDNGNENNNIINGTTESKLPRIDFDQFNDLTEINYIPVEEDDDNSNNNNHNHDNDNENNNNDNKNKNKKSEIFIHPGDEILSTSDLHTPININKSKIKFDSCITALLVPERLELPCKDLFYNASDFQLFAIDYGDEIKEIMMTKRVSPQQAIAIYHSLPLNSSQIPPNTNDETQLMPTDSIGNEELKNESNNDNDDLDNDNENDELMKDNEEGNNGSFLSNTSSLSSTTSATASSQSIPPILVSSLKADIEHERTAERQRRDTLSSDLTQPRRGWYPGLYYY